MCTGTLYWANIGRLVYGFEEAKLLAETGDHAENPTMSLASRTVLGSGQKPIEVVGPFPEIEDELLAPHRQFLAALGAARVRSLHNRSSSPAPCCSPPASCGRDTENASRPLGRERRASRPRIIRRAARSWSGRITSAKRA